MNEPTFRNLFADLGIFFGCVAAFVLGFLGVSYVFAPSRNPYGFWLGFLVYMFVFSKALRWLLNRRGSRSERAKRAAAKSAGIRRDREP